MDERASSRGNDSRSQDVVFIDSAVPDVQTLLSGLKPGAEVHVLRAGEDELVQIARALASTTASPRDIHLVSHATPGKLLLGHQIIDRCELERYGQTWTAIHRSLGSRGRLLLYGCELGAGAEGRAFVRELSAAIGAPVAASTNLTGAKGKGGDWNLEIGSVSAASLAFDEAALAHYGALLTPSNQNFDSQSTGDISNPITIGGLDFTGRVGGSSSSVHNFMDGNDPFFDIISSPGDNGLIFNTDSSFNSVTGAADYRIATSDSSAFKLVSMEADMGNGGVSNISTMVVTGYRSGSAVSGATGTVNFGTSGTYGAITYSRIANSGSTGGTLTFSSAFQNIDEIRFTTSGGSDYVLLAVDSLVFSAPVATSVSSINRQTPAGALTNAASLVYRVTFSASVTGVTTGAFSLTGTGTASGSIASVSSSSGTTIDVTVNSVAGDGTLRLDLSNTTGIQDGSSQALSGTYTSGQTYTLDHTAPTISIGSPSASITRGGPITYTVTYSDSNFNASTLATGNITLNSTGTANATVGVSGLGTTRTVTLSSITGDGTLGISIASGTASDNAGNTAPSAGPSTTFTVDNTAPTISIGSPSASITRGGPITYTITYSDSNFNASTLATGNITLNSTGTANATVGVSGSGTTRTVTLSSITGDGTLGISIASGTASDTAGNTAPSAGPSTTFTVDNTAPTISIGSPSASLTASGPITYTVTYSDSNFNSSTLANGNITLNSTGTANATVNVTGSGTTRTVTLSSITGNGTLGISIASGTASDTAGNTAGSAGPSTTFTVDNSGPTISIGAPSASVTAGGPVTFTVTYSDPNFNASTLSTGNITLNATGTASATVGVTGSGTTRTVTLSSITGDGTLGISIAAGTASDNAGNTSPSAGPSTTFTVDNTAPAAPALTAITTDTGTVGDFVTSDTTLLISGTAEANSTITMTRVGVGIIGTTTANGSGAWSFDYTGTTLPEGTHTFRATASDAAGNTSAFSTDLAVTVDTTAPSVSSINRQTPSGANTSALSVVYRATFSSPVSGVDASDFSLTATGTAAGTIASVSSVSTSVYDVTVNSISGDGSLRLDLKSSGTGITDVAGNAISGGFTSGQTYTVDHTAPAISIGAPSSSIVSSGSVTYTVTYSDTNFNASTLATGDVTLNATGTATATVGVSGSGTTRTVTLSGVSGNGTLGISIASGTASDLAGNTAAAAGPSTTFAVDTLAPTVSIGAPSVSATRAGPVTYTVTYADANFNASTLVAGNVTLNTTGTATGTIGVTGSGTTRTVTISSITGSGTIGISLAGGTGVDLAGNLAAGAGPSTTFSVDNTPPTVTLSAPSSTITNTGPVTYTVTYADSNFSSSTLVAGNVTLNTTGTANGTVAVSGSGTTRTVTISSITGNGTLGISLAAGTAVDTVGNTSAAAGPSTTFTVDNTPPAAPVITGITTDAGVSATDGITNDSTLIFAGTAEANSTVTLTRAGLGSIGSATANSGGAWSFNYTGTVLPDGVYSFTATATDAAGNTGAASTAFAVTIDTTAPTVASINRQNPSAATVSSGTVVYRVTFSELVNGITGGAFLLTATGSATGTLASVSAASGTSVDVTVNSVGGTGTLRLDLPSGSAIMDTAGNVIAAAFTSGQTYTVLQPPVISSALTASGANGSSFSYTITASNSPTAFTATGLPTGLSVDGTTGVISGIPAQIGTFNVALTATNAAGSGSATLVLTISKIPQTISFAALADRTTSDGSFTLSATASSGLPVTFAIVSGPAMLAGNTVTLTGAPGLVTVRASQAGNATYLAAPDVDQIFNVVQIGPQMFFGALSGSSTGSFAAHVTADGATGEVAGYLPSVKVGFFGRLTLSSSGTFSASVTPIYGANPPAIQVQLTVQGQLVAGVLSGTIPELGLTFSATRVPANGPTAPLAAFYVSDVLGTTVGSVYTAVGSGGQLFSLVNATGLLDAVSGTIASSGDFSLRSDAGTTFSGHIDAAATTIRGSILPTGASQLDYAGLSTTTLRNDRLINLSSRARAGAGVNALVTGFVIGGTSPKPVLVRAVGNGLSAFGVSGVFPDPQIQLYKDSAVIGSNNDWDAGTNTSDLIATSARVGAFPLAPGSKDSALLVTLAPGVYTAQVSNGTAQGVALAEIYDASLSPTADYQRLVNISSRGFVGSGDNVLIGGFVVVGNAPKRVLVRGVGPALSGFGIDGALSDPQLALYRGSTLLAQNDNWSSGSDSGAAVSTASSKTGAFTLTSGSKDAALVVTLAPGNYTVIVSGVGNATGIGLVEIYEVPQ